MQPVHGLRRIPMRIIYATCPDWWGEIHCWRHSRRYRAMSRQDPDVCPWEVVYTARTLCPVVH